MYNHTKVLYISHTSEFYGSGKALLNIILQMKEKGVDVFIVLPDLNGELYEEIRRLNIQHAIHKSPLYIWPSFLTLRDYCLFPYRFLRFFIKKYNFEKQLIQTVKTYMPDIIHTNVGVIHAGHYAAKKMKIPHVWHIREYQDLDFGWRPYPTKNKFSQLLSDRNNYPVAITKGVYEHHNLERNGNSQIIYDGVFDAEAPPEIKIKKKKYFLFVGLVSEGKGTEEAIKGFLLVAAELTDYELWIAGGGSTQYIEKLKKLGVESGFSERIKFLGHRTDVYQLMSEATALIVSSKFEGFGFITTEAMFNGCLVVGRNSAGTKEQFDNGLIMQGCDIALRYDNFDELKFLLNKICHNGIDSYLEILIKAQQTVVNLYSMQRNFKEILQLYKDILRHDEQ